MEKSRKLKLHNLGEAEMAKNEECLSLEGKDSSCNCSCLCSCNCECSCNCSCSSSSSTTTSAPFRSEDMTINIESSSFNGSYMSNHSSPSSSSSKSASNINHSVAQDM